MGESRHAYADESVYVTGNRRMYLMCATVFSSEWDDGMDALVAVKPKGAAKLHWRDMPMKLQTASLEALSEVSHTSTIIVASPLDNVRQERGRRLCLKQLLPLLEGRGIATITLESRNPVLDRRDVEMLDALRRQRYVNALRIEHVRGESDAHLWVPDQVLGAYGDEIVGREKQSRWQAAWEKVKANVTRVDVSL